MIEPILDNNTSNYIDPITASNGLSANLKATDFKSFRPLNSWDAFKNKSQYDIFEKGKQLDAQFNDFNSSKSLYNNSVEKSFEEQAKRIKYYSDKSNQIVNNLKPLNISGFTNSKDYTKDYDSINKDIGVKQSFSEVFNQAFQKTYENETLAQKAGVAKLIYSQGERDYYNRQGNVLDINNAESIEDKLAQSQSALDVFMIRSYQSYTSWLSGNESYFSGSGHLGQTIESIQKQGLLNHTWNSLFKGQVTKAEASDIEENRRAMSIPIYRGKGDSFMKDFWAGTPGEIYGTIGFTGRAITDFIAQEAAFAAAGAVLGAESTAITGPGALLGTAGGAALGTVVGLFKTVPKLWTGIKTGITAAKTFSKLNAAEKAIRLTRVASNTQTALRAMNPITKITALKGVGLRESLKTTLGAMSSLSKGQAINGIRTAELYANVGDKTKDLLLNSLQASSEAAVEGHNAYLDLKEKLMNGLTEEEKRNPDKIADIERVAEEARTHTYTWNFPILLASNFVGLSGVLKGKGLVSRLDDLPLRAIAGKSSKEFMRQVEQKSFIRMFGKDIWETSYKKKVAWDLANKWLGAGIAEGLEEIFQGSVSEFADEFYTRKFFQGEGDTSESLKKAFNWDKDDWHEFAIGTTIGLLIPGGTAAIRGASRKTFDSKKENYLQAVQRNLIGYNKVYSNYLQKEYNKNSQRINTLISQAKLTDRLFNITDSLDMKKQLSSSLFNHIVSTNSFGNTDVFLSSLNDLETDIDTAIKSNDNDKLASTLERFDEMFGDKSTSKDTINPQGIKDKLVKYQTMIKSMNEEATKISSLIESAKTAFGNPVEKSNVNRIVNNLIGKISSKYNKNYFNTLEKESIATMIHNRLIENAAYVEYQSQLTGKSIEDTKKEIITKVDNFKNTISSLGIDNEVKSILSDTTRFALDGDLKGYEEHLKTQLELVTQEDKLASTKETKAKVKYLTALSLQVKELKSQAFKYRIDPNHLMMDVLRNQVATYESINSEEDMKKFLDEASDNSKVSRLESTRKSSQKDEDLSHEALIKEFEALDKKEKRNGAEEKRYKKLKPLFDEFNEKYKPSKLLEDLTNDFYDLLKIKSYHNFAINERNRIINDFSREDYIASLMDLFEDNVDTMLTELTLDPITVKINILENNNIVEKEITISNNSEKKTLINQIALSIKTLFNEVEALKKSNIIDAATESKIKTLEKEIKDLEDSLNQLNKVSQDNLKLIQNELTKLETDINMILNSKEVTDIINMFKSSKDDLIKALEFLTYEVVIGTSTEDSLKIVMATTGNTIDKALWISNPKLLAELLEKFNKTLELKQQIKDSKPTVGQLTQDEIDVKKAEIEKLKKDKKEELKNVFRNVGKVGDYQSQEDFDINSIQELTTSAIQRKYKVGYSYTLKVLENIKEINAKYDEEIDNLNKPIDNTNNINDSKVKELEDKLKDKKDELNLLTSQQTNNTVALSTLLDKIKTLNNSINTIEQQANFSDTTQLIQTLKKANVNDDLIELIKVINSNTNIQIQTTC